MKKRVKNVILAVLTVIVGVFAFAACKGEHEHKYVKSSVKEATCEEDGAITYKCIRCDRSYTEEIDLKGHVDKNGDDTCDVCGFLTYTSGLVFTLNGEENSYSVADYNGSEATVIIPQKYKGLPVTGIGDEAFFQHKNLARVNIPEGITDIGRKAFACCYAMSKINIPSSVVNIGERAFAECEYVKEIKFNAIEMNDLSEYDTIFQNVGIYGEGVKVTVGEKVKELPSYLFYCSYGENKIVSVKFDGESVCESIGDYAFGFCQFLKSVEIPDGVIMIGEGAFYCCYGLENTVIGKSVSYIGESAFFNCFKLAEVYDRSFLGLIKGGTFNGYAAYYALNVYSPEYGESKLFETEDGYRFFDDGETVCLIGYSGDADELLLPDFFNGKNYGIYQYAFLNCGDVRSVVIGDGVTYIGDCAFQRCYNLEGISVGNGITGIGNDVFSATAYSENGENWTDGALYLTSRDETVKYLLETDRSLKEKYSVDEKTTVIAEEAFCYRSFLEEVEIPESVISIGERAFTGCTVLKSVEIPDGVTEIGDDTFARCTALTSAVIGNGVKRIGANAFGFCNSLMRVVIGSSVTEIEENAFKDCEKLIQVFNLSSLKIIVGDVAHGSVAYFAVKVYTDLTEWNDLYVTEEGLTFCENDDVVYLVAYNGETENLTLPDSYFGKNYEIYDYAFYSCNTVKSIVIGDGVTAIGKYAFAFADKLETVIIGDSVKSIGDHAFASCDSLTSVVIGDGVTVIDQYAFYLCYNLASVIIGDGVTVIGKYAFQGCYSLSCIEIPDNVESIGECAFFGCKAMEKITLGDGVTVIEKFAFSRCDSLNSLEIPSGVIKIGQWAFEGCSALESVIFEDSEGWYYTASPLYVGGYKLDVSDPLKAARYLTMDHSNTNWYKE